MTTFDPYHQWLGIPPNEQPAHHYRLLGISIFETDLDVIDAAADRQMSYLAKCAIGPHLAESQRLLNELSAARVCLLKPAKKAEYDAKLKADLAAKEPATAAKTTVASPDPEKKKKPGSLRKQAEQLLAEHEYARAQQVLRELMASTVPAEKDDAVWARQQLAKAKTGDENMRRQAESAIQYSRELIKTHDYSGAVQLLEQFPPKFRTEKMAEILEEATGLQQEVDLLQVDISRFKSERDFVGLKAAVQRFRELKPGNVGMKQLWTDLNTYGNKPVVFLEPDERKTYASSMAGGITTGQMVGGAAFVSLLFGAILYATFYYVGNTKKGIEKTVATADESTWKVELQIDNPAANVTIDGKPVKLTGNRTTIYLLPGRHEWTATLSAGETKSGQIDVRKMESNSLVISTGRAAAPTSEPSISNLPWNTPDFQAWLKETSALEAEQQVAAVAKRLQELNPGFDGNVTHKIENGVVTEFEIRTTNITRIEPVRALKGLQTLNVKGGVSEAARGDGQLSDLSPLTGLKLTALRCSWNRINDLRPLIGMPLTEFHCGGTQVSDLSPLKGMPLLNVSVSVTPVSDLSPLSNMQLDVLFCYETPVSDLSPLKGMPLKVLVFWGSKVTDVSCLKDLKLSFIAITPADIITGMNELRQMSTLSEIGVGWEANKKFSSAEFWKKYDAGEFGKLPLDVSKMAWNTPEFQAWLKQVSTMDAEQQVVAVIKRLRELNPKFDGQEKHQIENQVVSSLTISTKAIKEISPVRALTGLRNLELRGYEGGEGSGLLSDLSALYGMKLKLLEISWNPVSDLSPLRGMQLDILHCAVTKVSDLSPLRGSPLKGINLTSSPVSNLSPLMEMNLDTLLIDGTDVTDLSPLSRFKLVMIDFTPKNILKGIEVIRGMSSLTKIGTSWNPQDNWSPDEFWKKYDAGEFGKRSQDVSKLAWNTPEFQAWMKQVSTMDAEQQVAAVMKKLKELNPEFDGTETHEIENGVVTALRFSTMAVKNISPVRALTGLKSLRVLGDVNAVNRSGQLSDLTPLAGMKLEVLWCSANALSDLSPLIGVPLKELFCGRTNVADLSPLKGMPLRTLSVVSTPVSDLSALSTLSLDGLYFYHSQVTDLSPLKGMKLQTVTLTPKRITKGMEILRTLDGLGRMGVSGDIKDIRPAEEFWKKYDAGEYTRPGKLDGQPITDINNREFQKWLKSVATLPAKNQLQEVATKLQELNPGFDGALKPKIENDGVTELEFSTDNVSDIAPVRALPKLTSLSVVGSEQNTIIRGTLDDLRPLRGMKLKAFSCAKNIVKDLSPLSGMPLSVLMVEFTRVTDLTPLHGLKLTIFKCYYTEVNDISPLKEMPLKELAIQGTKVLDLSVIKKMKLVGLDISATDVTDISPLKGVHIEHLYIQSTKVADLTPLAGMPLLTLACSTTSVTDLTPLKDSKLTRLIFTPSKITKGLDVIRQLKSLGQIWIGWENGQKFSAADFWKKYDAGDFNK